MARLFASRQAGRAAVGFPAWRVPNLPTATEPLEVELVIRIGPGDTPAPVITITTPGED